MSGHAKILLCGALIGLEAVDVCNAFSATNLPSTVSGQRSSSLQLRMGSESDAISRRNLLQGFAGVAGLSLMPTQEAGAYKGQYAKLDLQGSEESMSTLGKNDIPAAGKIDPYEDREKANAVYAERMADPARIAEKKAKALAVKEKIFSEVGVALGKEDWQQARSILNRDLLNLRQAMNAVSTKGLKAVSAAQKGGEPDKGRGKAEQMEKDYLNSLNRLAVILDGSLPSAKGKVDFGKANTMVAKAESQWEQWLSMVE